MTESPTPSLSARIYPAPTTFVAHWVQPALPTLVDFLASNSARFAPYSVLVVSATLKSLGFLESNCVRFAHSTVHSNTLSTLQAAGVRRTLQQKKLMLEQAFRCRYLVDAARSLKTPASRPPQKELPAVHRHRESPDTTTYYLRQPVSLVLSKLAAPVL